MLSESGKGLFVCFRYVSLTCDLDMCTQFIVSIKEKKYMLKEIDVTRNLHLFHLRF